MQLEQHSRVCFRKRLQPRLLKQRAKHPVKIHIWGGISTRGATDVIMFTGIMDSQRLSRILEVGLLPFLRCYYPDGHRLQQDNDPKHASKHIEDFFKEHGVNWWPTPPESPDMNPIENIWGSLNNTYEIFTNHVIWISLKREFASFGPPLHQRFASDTSTISTKLFPR